MKWKIGRIIIILVAVFQFQLIGFLNPLVEKAEASSSADMTVYFTPMGGPLPPFGFTATYINDYTVKLDWTKAGSANNTMIRVKDNGYPTSATDGNLVFFGDALSTNDTAVDYFNFLGKKYYAAFTDNQTGDNVTWAWSMPSYIALEGPSVSDLVTQVTNFNALLDVIRGQYIALFLMLGMLALTLWRKEVFLYVVTSLITVFIALSWVKVSPPISLCLLGMACYLLYEAVRLSFFKKKSERKEQEDE